MKKTRKEKIEEAQTDYYDLNTDAVKNLAYAFDEENAQKISESKEIEKKVKAEKRNGLDFLSRIPIWLKAVFIKYWMAGVVCYLFFVGIGYYVSDVYALILVAGVAQGIFTDLLTNTMFLYFEKNKEYHPYMLLPVSCKKVWTFAINIPFGLIEVILVYLIYTYINYLIVTSRGIDEGTVILGVEPLLYGVFFVLIDMAFIGIKDLVVYLIKKAKTKTI